MKEGIVGAASRVCGIVRMRTGEKTSSWWNEVRELVRKKKWMYRRLLDTGTKDARRHTMIQRLRPREWLEEQRTKIGCS